MLKFVLLRYLLLVHAIQCGVAQGQLRLHVLDQLLQLVFRLHDLSSGLVHLSLERIHILRLNRDLVLHLFNLSGEAVQLGRCIFLVLQLERLDLCDLVVHDVKDVFVLARPVEDRVVQVVRVLQALLKLAGLPIQIRFCAFGHLSDWLHHVVADLLDARLDIEPVKLVHLVQLLRRQVLLLMRPGLGLVRGRNHDGAVLIDRFDNRGLLVLLFRLSRDYTAVSTAFLLIQRGHLDRLVDARLDVLIRVLRLNATLGGFWRCWLGTQRLYDLTNGTYEVDFADDQVLILAINSFLILFLLFSIFLWDVTPVRVGIDLLSLRRLVTLEQLGLQYLVSSSLNFLSESLRARVLHTLGETLRNYSRFFSLQRRVFGFSLRDRSLALVQIALILNVGHICFTKYF